LTYVIITPIGEHVNSNGKIKHTFKVTHKLYAQQVSNLIFSLNKHTLLYITSTLEFWKSNTQYSRRDDYL